MLLNACLCLYIYNKATIGLDENLDGAKPVNPGRLSIFSEVC